MYHRYIKRWFDCLVAATALVVLAPLLALIALLVRVKLGAPVLFRQDRPGLNGELFTMYKYRTMLNAYDATGTLLPDSERLTPFGRWLRSISLDELPELFNVLRGDMSIVGPRPLLATYLSRYTLEQARRHHVRPGITGWAQINGRNSVDWAERFQLDVWYVDHRSLWLDVTIIARTVGVTFARKGIHQDGHATMEEFRGT